MELKTNNFKRQMETTDFQQAQNKQLIFSVADEIPYLRHDDIIGDYYEVLEISEKAIDTTRLTKNMPFLKDHDHSAQLGAVKRFWLQDKKLYVAVKFSRSRFAQSIKQDIIDLIRQNTSIGYFVDQFERTGVAEDGIPILRAVKWTPYQCSSVSVPASVFVGYNRSIEVKQKGEDMNAQDNKTDSAKLAEQVELETKKTDVDLENKDLAVENLEAKSTEATEGKEEETKGQEGICPDCGKPIDECECEDKACGETEKKDCGGEQKPEEKKLEPTAEELRAALIKSLEADAKEIRELGEIVGDRESAEKFVAEHRSLDQFKTYLKTKDSDKSKNSIQDNTKMEKRYFSVSKLINAINNNAVDTDSYEFKTNEENKRALGIDNQRSIFLTKSDLNFNAKYRAYDDGFNGTLTGTGYPNGGDTLIQFQYRPDMYAINLRPQLTLEKTGYKDVTSPDGRPIEWPVCVSGINAAMVDLDGNLPSTSMGWRNVRLQGKKIGGIAYIPYSLLKQAAPQADAIIEEDLIRDLYQIRDTKVFTGEGTTSSAYEPLGILNNTDVNQVSTSGFTWADFVDAEVKIRESNDFSENLAWVMSPATYGTLRATAKNAGNNGYVYGFICEDEKIGRYPVYCNPAIPDDKVILGNFNELVVCDFAGLEIIVDPFTGLQNNQIRVAGWIQMDATIQRPKSFTVITKS